MALTLADSWCANGGAAQASVTSPPFVPPVNSIICVEASCFNTSGDDTGTIVISDTAGLTWTTHVIVSQLTDGAGINPPPIAIWTAQVGGSPVSMTITTAVQDGLGFAHFQAARVYTGHNTTTPVIDTDEVIGTTAAVSLSLNSGAATGCIAFAGCVDWDNHTDTFVAEPFTTTQCAVTNADIQASWAGFKDGISGAITIGTQVLGSPQGTNAVAILLQPAAAGTVSGTLAVDIPVPTVALDGEITASGVLDASVPVPVVALDGEITASGVLGVDLPVPAVSLDGELVAAGTIGIDFPVPVVSLDGELSAAGVLAVDIPVPLAAFDGELSLSGQLDLVLPVPDVSLTGELPVSGVLSIDIPVPVVDLIGVSAAGGATMGPCGWTIPDPLCSDTWAGTSAEIKAAARDYAALVLWGATGREFGLCEITVRPCGWDRCGDNLWNFFGWTWGSGTWVPYIFQGVWHNCACPGICNCEPRCQISLQGDVDSIIEVLIDGIAVDPDTYRVDDKHWLVRNSPDCWPLCPDMDSAEPTLQVTYLRGNPVPVALLRAASILADEWAKACLSLDCRLSNKVTSIARNGIQIDMNNPEDMLSGGMTGIWEVDSVINAVNPHKRKQRGRVYAPELRVPRTTTWP